MRDLETGPIVDLDVHHTYRSDEDVFAHMSRRWRDYMREHGLRIKAGGPAYSHEGGIDKRLDTFPEDGSMPGSDYGTMRRQLLDGLGVERAVLGFDAGNEVAHPNPYLAAEIARALNDWNLETWLHCRDDRIYSSVLVANHVPAQAAEEIRRVGAHPHIVEVLLATNGLGQPFGHPAYNPIFEAAEELGLVLSIHIAQGALFKNYLTAGGTALSRLEYHTLLGQPVFHHLTSFITHGVFEKFSRLKVVIKEAGVIWLPWLVWNLDAAYRELRRESDWVKRLPSEYVRERVRLTSQPLELSPKRGQLIRALESFPDFEQILCFATDYPHWDADDPTHVAGRLPKAWLGGFFHDNASEFYGWPLAARSTAGVV